MKKLSYRETQPVLVGNESRLQERTKIYNGVGDLS